MGWCSGTEVFDDLATFILDSTQSDELKIMAFVKLIESLESNDWDCQQDSDHYDNPLVRKAFRQAHPDWESLQGDDTPESRMDEFLNSYDDPIKSTLSLLASYGQTGGSHHLAWVIDQTTRILTGEKYSEFIKLYSDGEDGDCTYEWDEGVPP